MLGLDTKFVPELSNCDSNVNIHDLKWMRNLHYRLRSLDLRRGPLRLDRQPPRPLRRKDHSRGESLPRDRTRQPLSLPNQVRTNIGLTAMQGANTCGLEFMFIPSDKKWKKNLKILCNQLIWNPRNIGCKTLASIFDKDAESPAVKKITARRTLSSSSSSSLPGHLAVKRTDSTASNSSFLSRQGEGALKARINR